MVLQSGYAAFMSCHRRSDVGDARIHVHLGADEGPDAAVVLDDVLAHELELIHHDLRQGLASDLLQRLDLLGDLVEACLQEKAVRWHLGFGLREVLAHPDHLVVHGRDPVRDRGLDRVETTLDGGHLLSDRATCAVDVAAHLEANLRLLLDVALEALRDPAELGHLSQVSRPL